MFPGKDESGEMKTAEQFIKDLLQRGRYSFTIEEAARQLGKEGPALNTALQRLKQAGWIVPFSRGFYLALDVQHQGVGILDPAWFIDDWARHVRAAYYVGGLSAAALHGAAHQRPMQFQVFADRQLRPVQRRGVQLVVFYKKRIPDSGREKRKSPAGYFYVSRPELTAYDLIAYPRCCPSLDHAATVLVELAEALDADRLARLAETAGDRAVWQRVGWLLERLNWPEKAGALYTVLAQRQCSWVPLEPRLPARGTRNRRWSIIENSDIQPDIER